MWSNSKTFTMKKLQKLIYKLIEESHDYDSENSLYETYEEEADATGGYSTETPWKLPKPDPNFDYDKGEWIVNPKTDDL